MNEEIPEGKIGAIIGRRRSGKTTTGLRMMEGVPSEMIKAREVHGSDWSDRGCEILGVPALVDRMQWVDEEIFIFEDATPLFQGRVSDKFQEAMVRTRKHGVSIIMMFHSFRKTPNDIFDMVDWIIIHKTADQEFRITDRTDEPIVLEAFRRVKASKHPHARAEIDMYLMEVEYFHC